MSSAEEERAERVLPLELFFDLVFVFTITQLTQVLTDALSWTSLWHVVVMLSLIFWMYDGYAWLTNSMTSRDGRDTAWLLVAMAAYLVLAIAIPGAFTGTGLTFAITYLVINLIHSYLFLTTAGDEAVRAMSRIAPPNIAGAVVVLIGGAFGNTVEAVLWTVTVPLLWIGSPRIGHGAESGARMSLGAAHFIERHGLVVLIALGESVAASGIAAREDLLHRPLGLDVVLVVLLGLAVSASLWWIYFLDGDERLADAFGELEGEGQFRAGLYGFGYAHAMMLLGIVLTAVGIRFAVVDPGGRVGLAPAFALSGGVAVFLIARDLFRMTLKLSSWNPAQLGPVLVLAAVPLTTLVNTDAGLVLTALLAVAVAVTVSVSWRTQTSE